MELCHAALSDRQAITDLWTAAFGDTPDGVAYFFRSFPHCRSYVARTQGRAVSMVHALERVLTPDCKAAYIYAVATDPTFRGQGLCRRLMAFAETDLKNRGYDCCVLRPGNEGLFDFYKKLGYETAFYRSHHVCSGGEVVSATEYARLREQVLTVPHTVCDENLLNYASSVYGLTFYRTAAGCSAAAPGYTAECLPEDLCGAPDAMIKWLTEPRPMAGAYLGFALE